MMIYHNSHDTFYRNPFGALQEGEKVVIRLKIDNNLIIKNVYLRLWTESDEEKINMERTQKKDYAYIYEAVIEAKHPDILWYYFIVETDDKTYYYCNNDEHLGGIGTVKDTPLNSYQITTYKKGFQTPSWFKDSIMYQIFVDRFYNGNDGGDIICCRDDCTIHSNWDEMPEYKPNPATGKYQANDFFGGNLKGIIKKLPYLKELGVDVIYLNPIFEAFSNHKYDTGDYTKVDPMFGDNYTFRLLCSEADKYRISIILDGVFNHTGSSSIYFNKDGKYPSVGAYQSKDSPYYKWYRFKNYPNEYECWWGVETLPNVEELEPSYMDFIIKSEDSIAKRWIKDGAKGWRLDVVDEIPDEFLKEFRTAVKETDSEAVIIGEVWEDASNKVSYGKLREYFQGEELDSVMNYPLRDMVINFLLGRWDAERFNKAIMSLYENYPKECFYSLMNIIGTHDVPRILTILGEAPDENSLSKNEKAVYKLSPEQRELAKKRLKLASLLQITFPGVPCIYYGDEAGLEGYSDPFNRRTYPWGHEDKEILEWYKKLTKIRHSTDALKTGEFVPIYAEGDVYGFVRRIIGNCNIFGEKKENGVAVILINRSVTDSHMVEVDMAKRGVKLLYDVIGDNREVKVENGRLVIELKPMEGKIFTSYKGRLTFFPPV